MKEVKACKWYKCAEVMPEDFDEIREAVEKNGDKKMLFLCHLVGLDLPAITSRAVDLYPWEENNTWSWESYHDVDYWMLIPRIEEIHGKSEILKESELSLNEYQEKAMSTRMDTCQNFTYMMMNLVGEVGEFAGKIAKWTRQGKAFIGDKEHCPNGLSFKTPKNKLEAFEMEKELKAEAGDILWQIAGLCDILGWTLEEVAQMNLDKLASRKERGVIDGNGDNR